MSNGHVIHSIPMASTAAILTEFEISDKLSDTNLVTRYTAVGLALVRHGWCRTTYSNRSGWNDSRERVGQQATTALAETVGLARNLRTALPRRSAGRHGSRRSFVTRTWSRLESNDGVYRTLDGSNNRSSRRSLSVHSTAFLVAPSSEGCESAVPPVQ